jgi:cytochrome c oxidase subunit II
MSDENILRSELRWTGLALGALSVMLAIITASAIAFALHPPSNIELVDQAALHLRGEFIESNLGTTVADDQSVTVRIVATQFAFIPRCAPVPAGKPVTIRMAAPDVVHGIIVTGTNVNTMVVPGFVSEVRTAFTQPGDYLMPCHEYCGLGHSEMWGTIQVLPQSEWPQRAGKVDCAAR